MATATATATKLSIIPCGAMRADLAWLLLKPGVTLHAVHDNDAAVVWSEVPTHAVLVETPEGKLLWDTSCPRDWEQRWVPTGLQDFFVYDLVGEDEYLDSRLNAMGVGLDEIDYVVLSHLHIDHAGNAGLFKNTNARLLCSDAERSLHSISRAYAAAAISRSTTRICHSRPSLGTPRSCPASP